MAHKDGKKSESKKDNRLLLREKRVLLFSKAKMAATDLSQ